MTTDVKRCSKCGEEKSLDDFYADAAKKDGKTSVCKPCAIAKSRQRHAAKRNEILEQNRKRYSENKELFAEKVKKWRAENRDKVRAMTRRWAERNPEAIKRAIKKWKQNNPDKVREAARRRYKARFEQDAGKHRAHAAKRRVAKLQRSCLLTPANEVRIKTLYAFAAYLTKKFGKPYHVDHVVPLRGETCSGLHVPDNLRVVPAQLNLSKGARIDYELVPHAFRPEDT